MTTIVLDKKKYVVVEQKSLKKFNFRLRRRV